MRSARRLTLVLVTALALVGCAARGPALRAVEAADRQQRLAMLGNWAFEGRIAVSDGRDGGSGRVDWRHEGAYYRVEVRAALGAGTWRLSGADGLAQLDGVHPEPVRDVDPEALLLRETGWRVPVLAAQSWVRGLPVDDRRARIRLGDGGLPARIEEGGWRIDYLDWFAATAERPAMPRRIVARRAPHELRIAIADWRLGG